MNMHISTVETESLKVGYESTELYLSRLRRLLEDRRDYISEPTGQGLILLDKSIFETYLNCLYTGAEVEAKDIIKNPTYLVERTATFSDAGKTVPKPYRRRRDRIHEKVREFYLNRLRRILRLRRDHEDDLNEKGLQILDSLISTTYYDSMKAGAKKAATKILKHKN